MPATLRSPRQDRPEVYGLLRRWDSGALTVWESETLLRHAGEVPFLVELRDGNGKPAGRLPDDGAPLVRVVPDYVREASVVQVGTVERGPLILGGGQPQDRITIAYRNDRRLATAEIVVLLGAELRRRRRAGISRRAYGRLLLELGPDFETCEPKRCEARVRQWRSRAQKRAPRQSETPARDLGTPRGEPFARYGS